MQHNITIFEIIKNFFSKLINRLQIILAVYYTTTTPLMRARFCFDQIMTRADLGLADAFIDGDISFKDENEGLQNLFLVRLIRV